MKEKLLKKPLTSINTVYGVPETRTHKTLKSSKWNDIHRELCKVYAPPLRDDSWKHERQYEEKNQTLIVNNDHQVSFIFHFHHSSVSATDHAVFETLGSARDRYATLCWPPRSSCVEISIFVLGMMVRKI